MLLMLLLYFIKVSSTASNARHYEVLHLSKNCTLYEIKRSFRKLALELHPDKVHKRSFHDKDKMNRQFLEVQEAYAVLSSPTRRLQYDLLLTGVDYEDYTEPERDLNMVPNRQFHFYLKTSKYRLAFATTFPPNSIPVIKVNIAISFAKTLVGVNNYKQPFHRREICDACKGTGGKNGDVEVCPFCNGIGQASHLFAHPSGSFDQMSYSGCAYCDGQGFIPKNKCDVCGGRGVVIGESVLNVNLKRGFRSGSTVHIKNAGHVTKDGRVGDVVATIKLVLPENWDISNTDGVDELVYDLKVPFAEILVGFRKTLFTPDTTEMFILQRDGIGKDTSVTTDHNAMKDGSMSIPTFPTKYTIEHLLYGFLEEFPNLGLVNEENEKRGILKVRVIADFSTLSASETVELFLQLHNIEMNEVFQNEDIMREYEILLKHLLSIQNVTNKLKFDTSLRSLLDNYHKTIMNMTLSSREEDETRSQNSAESNGISLDDFDFDLGPEDVIFAQK